MNKYYFIVNPIAGGGRAKSFVPSITSFFSERKTNFELSYTSEPHEAIETARKAAESGYNVIVAVGGDGTVNEILNGIVGTNAVLAAVHGGKGNDFAMAVNMPRDINDACRILLQAETRQIDLGKVLDRYFINSVGVGIDATVALRVNRGIKPFKGVAAYVYAFFEQLISYQPVEMEIDLGEGNISCRPYLVAVGIGQTYGGGMKILPDAVQDDGLFDICVFDHMSRISLAYHFPKVFSGKHIYLKQAEVYRAPEVKLTLSKECPLHMEGEILFGDLMHFTLIPRGMTVLTA